MYADILRVVLHRPEGICPTNIAAKANINTNTLWNEHLPTLLSNNLLVKKSMYKRKSRGRRPLTHYFITEKGSMFIKTFDESLKLLGYPPDTLFNKLKGGES